MATSKDHESLLNDLDDFGSDEEDDDMALKSLDQQEGAGGKESDDSEVEHDGTMTYDTLPTAARKSTSRAFSGGITRDISKVALLRKSVDFRDHMSSLARSIAEPSEAATSSSSSSSTATMSVSASSGGFKEDDKGYKLMVASNEYLLAIDEEMGLLYGSVVLIYSSKFPELESLIANKLDYIKTVQRIGNATDLSLVDLTDLLPPSTVMVISVTASTTSGYPLSPEDLGLCLQGCEEVLALDGERIRIASFVEGKMTHFAPNITAIIGSSCAAQLIGLAEGLVALSRIPSGYVQVIGQNKSKQLNGFSRLLNAPHVGLLHQCALVQGSPDSLQKRILKIVAAKVTQHELMPIDSTLEARRATACVRK